MPADPAPVIHYAPAEKAAAAFKRAFDLRFASGESLSAGAKP
jgi:hypothetical protein